MFEEASKIKMEEEILKLMEMNMRLENEKESLERRNMHLKSLLSEMQKLELERNKKKRRQSERWLYFQTHRGDQEILEMISQRHNLKIEEIPWQLIKRETDKRYNAKKE